MEQSYGVSLLQVFKYLQVLTCFVSFDSFSFHLIFCVLYIIVLNNQVIFHFLAKIPGLGWITDGGNEELISLINSYLPVVALLTLILILPYIFEAVAIYYEHRKTLSDVTRTTVSRYFYYQVSSRKHSFDFIFFSGDKLIS